MKNRKVYGNKYISAHYKKPENTTYSRKSKVKGMGDLGHYNFGYWNLIPKGPKIIDRCQECPLIPKLPAAIREQRVKVTHIDMFFGDV